MVYTTTIRSKRQRVVTALDIGTSKICCLIAKTSPAPDWFEGKGEAVQFDVLGFDHTRAEGLKAGMVAHLDSAEACIRSAVDAAERMAGVTVEDVHVSEMLDLVALETATFVGGDGGVVSPAGGDGGVVAQAAVAALTAVRGEWFPAAS